MSTEDTGFTFKQYLGASISILGHTTSNIAKWTIGTAVAWLLVLGIWVNNFSREFAYNMLFLILSVFILIEAFKNIYLASIHIHPYETDPTKEDEEGEPCAKELTHSEYRLIMANMTILIIIAIVITVLTTLAFKTFAWD